MRIKAFYSPAYFADTETESMRKLPVVARIVSEEGLADLVDPGFIAPDKLRQLHNPLYVDAFLNGTEPLASSPGWRWTHQIRDGVLAIHAGQLAAAETALREGIAANIGQGFHHAEYDHGAGFCVFNGFALVAQEHPDKKICVLDCDEHEGNGTAEFTKRLANLHHITIHGSKFTGKQYERSIGYTLSRLNGSFKPFEEALAKAYAQILDWKPDLLIYQSGADPHENDPLGTLGMTTEQLLQRDRSVFRFCEDRHIPMFFMLGGGYQEDIENRLAPLHVNTFRAAAESYNTR